MTRNLTFDPDTVSWFTLSLSANRNHANKSAAGSGKMGDELLKIGKLAKRSGMSVRMLRHYDRLLLLKPSVRNDANYRLYGREDVARLHSIQALRQVGLPLHEIKQLLAGNDESFPQIIRRQIATLEHQAQQANELCGRLKLVQSTLNRGYQPNMSDWLAVLESMSTYAKYFSASELETFFESAKKTQAQWAALIADIHAEMEAKTAPTDLKVQPLARRWMDLSVQMARGNFPLMKRWEKMYLQEPSARGKQGDKLESVLYINHAIDLRVKAFHKYLSQAELERLDYELEGEWHALSKKLQALSRSRRASGNAKLKNAINEWEALILRTANHDQALAKKFEKAFACDTLLKSGSIFGAELEDFIRRARESLNQTTSTANRNEI